MPNAVKGFFGRKLLMWKAALEILVPELYWKNVQQKEQQKLIPAQYTAELQ